jgi:hypothetical protein
MVDDCQGNPVRGRELRVLENDQIVQIRAKGESVPIADGVTMACLARGNVVGQVSDEVRSAFTVLRERPVYEGGFHLSIDNEGPGDSAAVDEALSEVISRYDLPRPIEEKLFRLDDFGRDVFGYRIASTIGSLHIVARGFDYTPRRGLTRARESFLRKVQSFPLIGAPLAPSADYSESQQRSPSLIGNSPALFLQNICDQLSTAIWPTEDRFLVRGSRLKRITLRAQIGDEVVHCQGFDLRSERARRNANLLLIGEFVEKGVLTTHPFNDAVARALDHRHEMLCKFPELENPLGIVGA